MMSNRYPHRRIIWRKKNHLDPPLFGTGALKAVARGHYRNAVIVITKFDA